MSCYSCGTSFGAFKREHGCKNCGFAFCSKCLPHKVEIPKCNNEKHKVCMKCYNIMTGKVKPKDEPARYSPPENFKKRVQALKEREEAGNNAPAPGVSGLGRGKTPQHVAGIMSKADFEIKQRLDKLKEKSPQEIAAGKVSEEHIDDRLARLKGMDPEQYKVTNKPTYRPPDRRTQQEQMNNLMDEINSEVELDSRRPDPAKEIEERLARLRQGPDANKDNTEGTGADTSENNLNKPSMRDSQTFVQNISDVTSSSSTTSDNTNVTSGNKPPDTGGSSSGSGGGVKKSQSGGSGMDEEVSAEEVGRILTEAAEGLELDAKRALQGLEQDKEIMRRLQDVKQRRKESSTDVNKDDNLEHSDSENEDENEDEDDDDVQAEAVIKQALAEARLDEAAEKDGVALKGKDAKTKPDKGKKSNNRTGGKNGKDDDEWYDPDELPYCCICTEDATVRCIDCDMDLYCSKCFKDGHKELGLTDHKSIKYTPPKGRT